MEVKRDRLDKGAVVQRDKETYAVVPHIPGGIVFDTNVLRKIADVADRYQAKALKLTTAQRIAIVGVKEEELDQIWADLDMDPGFALGICVRSVRICPATAFCKRAQQDAVPIGLEMDKRYHGMQLPGKCKMAISGCQNACTEPVVKDIGVMGTTKGYTILVGGNAGLRPRLADVLAKEVQPEQVLPLLDRIVAFYKENAKPHERMGMMIDRIGLDKLKEAAGR